MLISRTASNIIAGEMNMGMRLPGNSNLHGGFKLLTSAAPIRFQIAELLIATGSCLCEMEPGSTVPE